MKYIMSLDQGTTSSRVILFDKSGKAVSTAQKELTQHYPKAGWVEHDAIEIWASQIGVAREAMLKIGADASDISAIGITNQRETTVMWDKSTGKPVCNAIVWQCRRTAEICNELINQGLSEFFQDKTGLRIDAYFSATKIKWILDNISGVREKAEKGEILFGTIETWLIWNLTGGKVHVTDYSTASRTMLYNINTLQWDEEILNLLNIPKAILPEVKDSSGKIGDTLPSLFGDKIIIGGCAGDQQAALFGQRCFNAGNIKNTYGTGAFLLMNTGVTPKKSQNGLLTTIAWGINGKVTYALEGSVFVAGAVVQWLRDELCIVKSAAETEEIALSIPNTNGVYTVPAFVGIGAPHWNQDARGTITGLTRGSNRAHIVRSALESIAYQTADVLKVMVSDSGYDISDVKVDGGASNNNFLMQFQADILDRKVIRPNYVESTARGAAFLAGLAVGFWEDIMAIEQINEPTIEFTPKMKAQERTELISGWKNAINKTLYTN